MSITVRIVFQTRKKGQQKLNSRNGDCIDGKRRSSMIGSNQSNCEGVNNGQGVKLYTVVGWVLTPWGFSQKLSVGICRYVIQELHWQTFQKGEQDSASKLQWYHTSSVYVCTYNCCMQVKMICCDQCEEEKWFKCPPPHPRPLRILPLFHNIHCVFFLYDQAT